MVALRLQVQLKDMDHLVPQRVAELREVATKRQSDPPLEEVGGTQQPRGRGERQDIRLFEIGVRGVHDQGYPSRDIMPKLEREGVVARLGIRKRSGRQLGFGGVIVEVDMRSPNDPPIEL